MQARHWLGTGFVLLTLVVRAGCAQLGPATTAAELQAQVRQDAAAYDQKLPSLSCRESSAIDEIKHGTVTKTMHLAGTIRVLRTSDAKEPLRESHTFAERDGTPIAQGKSVPISYWLTGGFANGLGHATPEADVCFDAHAEKVAAGWKLELTRHPDTDGLQVCRDHALPGYRKTLLLNDAGQVTHVERVMPPEVARQRRDASFAAMDFAPVSLGEETLWLPVRLESHDEKDEHRLEVRYSECKRFGGSITILPGVEKVPEP